MHEMAATSANTPDIADSAATDALTSARTPVALVVDDAAEMRDLMRDVLESHGWEVRTAGSGGRALRMLLQDAPDLVVLDLFMPGMTGFQLRAHMLDRPELARIPVIVLSAYWHRPSETLDAVAVIPKPINLDRLLEVVDGVRDQRERAAS